MKQQLRLNEVNIREDEPLSSSDVEWWTAEEYAKWLDEGKRSSAVYDWCKKLIQAATDGLYGHRKR